MDMRTMVAVKQQIDRAQLAEWDASARAWLRIADIAKNLQHKQLLLILGNLDKVVNSKPVLYDSVIKAWTTGMEGMEALLQGSPMMMQTGDMPLALSSWHIYPDLNIVSTTTKLVRQKDSLVPASGILTIGLERHDSTSSKGLQWSLPLAHLRFYGNPVKRVSELTIQGSRLSLLDLDMAVLGCVLGGWGDPDSDLDAIKWMSKISDLMVSTYPDESHRLKNTWLRILGKTASAFLEPTDTERQRFTKLLYLGRGRRSFIADRSPPFFGLTSIDLLMRMVRTSEQRVKILRAHMQRAGIPFEHAIIRYVPKTTGREEFASAAPRQRPTPKRTSPGSDSSRSKSSVGHIRWVHQTSAQLISPNEDLVERPHAGADVCPDIDADETNKEMERQAVADKRASNIILENEAEQPSARRKTSTKLWARKFCQLKRSTLKPSQIRAEGL
ncbi:hypothetical protein N8I77_000372 [Diaporthe amygdali]|uniref:Uncharacterized protein n=1 Tax=Phomopsis amygdali TaxID=1214568 RepID=A0AAD9W9R2_PHOAM|nr:hypothetical protein N8I77_000372 [Diaporthe amygdali]